MRLFAFFLLMSMAVASAASGQMLPRDPDDPAPQIMPGTEGEQNSKNDAAKVTPGAEMQTVAPAKPAFELGDGLDELFAQLGQTSDKKLGERIANRIWELWRESDSKSIDLLTHWARNAMGDKKYPVALDLLDQVVSLRPKFAEGWNQRATLHYVMKNYRRSITDIERTLTLEPRHFGALAGLANIFQILGDRERALETWYRVLAIYPSMKSAQDAVIKLEEDLAGRAL